MKNTTWEPLGWHGFDFTDANVQSDADRQRMIEAIASFRPPDLAGSVYLIERDGTSKLADCEGRATFGGGGDTLVFKHRTRDGYEQVYDLRVRAVYHPRRASCGKEPT